MAKDNLSRIPADDEPLEVVRLSSAYELLISRAWIGRAPAVQLKLRHTSASGEVSLKGGFLLFLDRLPEAIEALERACVLLQKEAMWTTR